MSEPGGSLLPVIIVRLSHTFDDFFPSDVVYASRQSHELVEVEGDEICDDGTQNHGDFETAPAKCIGCGPE